MSQLENILLGDDEDDDDTNTNAPPQSRYMGGSAPPNRAPNFPQRGPPYQPSARHPQPPGLQQFPAQTSSAGAGGNSNYSVPQPQQARPLPPSHSTLQNRQNLPPSQRQSHTQPQMQGRPQQSSRSPHGMKERYLNILFKYFTQHGTEEQKNAFQNLKITSKQMQSAGQPKTEVVQYMLAQAQRIVGKEEAKAVISKYARAMQARQQQGQQNSHRGMSRNSSSNGFSGRGQPMYGANQRPNQPYDQSRSGMNQVPPRGQPYKGGGRGQLGVGYPNPQRPHPMSQGGNHYDLSNDADSKNINKPRKQPNKKAKQHKNMGYNGLPGMPGQHSFSQSEPKDGMGRVGSEHKEDYGQSHMVHHQGIRGVTGPGPPTHYKDFDMHPEQLEPVGDNWRQKETELLAKDVVDTNTEAAAMLQGPQGGRLPAQAKPVPSNFTVGLTRHAHMGLDLKTDNEHKVVRVVSIADSAPDEIKAKLRPGDFIMGVDGMEGSNLRSVEVIEEAMLRGIPVGNAMNVVVQRGSAQPQRPVPRMYPNGSGSSLQPTSQQFTGVGGRTNRPSSTPGSPSNVSRPQFPGMQNAQSRSSFVPPRQPLPMAHPTPLFVTQELQERQRKEQWHEIYLASAHYTRAKISQASCDEHLRFNAEVNPIADPRCKVLSESVQLYIQTVLESLTEISDQRRNSRAQDLFDHLQRKRLRQHQLREFGDPGTNEGLVINFGRDHREELIKLSDSHQQIYQKKEAAILEDVDKEIIDAEESYQKNRRKNRQEEWWIKDEGKIKAGKVSKDQVARLRLKRHSAEIKKMGPFSQKKAKHAHYIQQAGFWQDSNANQLTILSGQSKYRPKEHSYHVDDFNEDYGPPIGSRLPKQLKTEDILYYLRQNKTNHPNLLLRIVSERSTYLPGNR